MYKIELNWNPPTGNQIRKMEHWKYAKLKREWINRLKAYFMVHKTPFPGNRKVYLIVDRPIRKAQPLDHMNLVWMCKPAFDALQEIGVLVDDSPDMLEERYVQSDRKGPLRIYLTTDKNEFDLHNCG